MQPAPQKSETPAQANEATFLGAYLMSFGIDDQSAKEMRIRMLETVKPHMFSVAAHRTIYEGILAFMLAEKAPDVVLFSSHLSQQGKLEQVGGVAYLMQILEGTPNCMAGDDYAHNVRECWSRRNVKKILADMSAEVDRNEVLGEVFDAQGTINKAISSIAQSSTGDVIRRGEDIVNDSLNLKFDQSEEPVSGIQKLDANLNLFAPGDLTVIAARASVGKSTLMRQLARRSERDGTILIFSMEVPEEILVLQFVCELAGISFFDYTHKPSTVTEAQREELALAACDPLFSRLAFYVKAPVSTVDVSLAICQLQAKGEKIQSVMIDYLGLMKHDRAERNDIAIGNTTHALKQLAMQRKVPIVLLTQISREADRRGGEVECARPRLSDLRDSGHIEQDADNVVLLWRKERGDEFKLVEPRVLTVAKHRLGMAFELDLMFDKVKGLFYAVGPDGTPEIKRPAPVAEWYGR